MLSFKLVTLLRSTAPDRPSDLAKRDSRFCTFIPEGVSFALPGQTKTSNRTKRFRSNNKDEQDKLFLSVIIPHKPVTSATLARWIKSYLQLAGVDTSIFSAHSLRVASTTTARNQDVSLSDILRMANWSQESTLI